MHIESAAVSAAVAPARERASAALACGPGNAAAPLQAPAAPSLDRAACTTTAVAAVSAAAAQGAAAPAADVAFCVTGFGPFGLGEVPDNPTQRLVEALPAFLASNPLPPRLRLWHATTLPTDAKAAVAQLATLLDTRPASASAPSAHRWVCLHLGVHITAERIQLERRAANDASFRFPDEAGWQPQGLAVDAARDADAPLLTPLPVEAREDRNVSVQEQSRVSGAAAPQRALFARLVVCI